MGPMVEGPLGAVWVDRRSRGCHGERRVKEDGQSQSPDSNERSCMFCVFFKPTSMNRSNAVTIGTHLYSDPVQKIGYDNVTDMAIC